MNSKKIFIALALISIISCTKDRNFKKNQRKPMCIAAYDINKTKFDNLKTSHGIDIEKILASGRKNQDSSIGCYAGDSESYQVFSPIFDYVVENYHHLKADSLNNHKNGKIVNKISKNAKKLILSTRIRVARNIEKYPFPSSMTLDERKGVENDLIKIFSSNKFFKNGKYEKLADMTNERNNDLVKSHLLFKDMSKDRFINASGIANNYPIGRGIYISNDKKTLIWVNEEDHMRIISMSKGGDIASVYNNLTKIHQEIVAKISFAKSDKYGFLTSCPTNIGTGMRASVLIKLKNLGKGHDLLRRIANKLKLDVRGEHGEHSKSSDMIFDISNKERLGKSEAYYIDNLIAGVNIIADIDHLIDAKLA
jgi:protein-arginine kinase